MREVVLNCDSLPGCCGVSVLSDFPHIDYNVGDRYGNIGVVNRPKPLTDTEWWNALYHDIDLTSAREAVIFSHSREGSGGVCTPAKLATWLRSKGETVHAVSSISRETRNHLTVYTWVVTKRFISKFNRYKNKKNKEEDAQRGDDAY